MDLFISGFNTIASNLTIKIKSRTTGMPKQQSFAAEYPSLFAYPDRTCNPRSGAVENNSQIPDNNFLLILSILNYKGEDFPQFLDLHLQPDYDG